MNGKDYTDYWVPACKNLFGWGLGTSDVQSWAEQLDAALGIRECADFWNRRAILDKPMSDELKRLLVALAGPHGRTILKAIQARRGDNDDRT